MRKFMFVVAVASVLAACGESESGGASSSAGSALADSERSAMSSASSSGYQRAATATTSCPGGALLCADFEGSNQLPRGWRASSENTVTVSSEQAYSGQNALKVTGAGEGYNQNFLVHDLTDVPELNEAMYGRMMIH